MKHFKLAVASLSLVLMASCGLEGQSAEAPATAEAAASLEGTLAGTWHLLTTESCNDIFRRACTASFPSPQCSATIAEGQACSGSPAICYKSLPGGANYREYGCY